MKHITRIASLFASVIILFTPALVSAEQGTFNYYTYKTSETRAVAPASGDIRGVANTIIFLINEVAVPVLFAIAFIVFLYGVFKSYIWGRGDEAAVEEGHKLILWGLIGFAVMISIWGIVNVVTATFGIRSDNVPRWPRSYYE